MVACLFKKTSGNEKEYNKHVHMDAVVLQQQSNGDWRAFDNHRERGKSKRKGPRLEERQISS